MGKALAYESMPVSQARSRTGTTFTTPDLFVCSFIPQGIPMLYVFLSILSAKEVENQRG